MNRALLRRMALGTCLFGPVATVMLTCPVGQVHAGPALARNLARRVELWQRPARGTGLTARYRLERSSSLLYEPLRTQGGLVFAPGSLELRDDERGGATTRLIGDALTIAANDPALPANPAAVGDGAAGRRWLRDRLFALFAARDAQALLADSHASVPRGPGMQIDLVPPRNHPARRQIRQLRVRLEPDTGEVVALELTETSGDVVTLTLSEHQRPS